MQMKIREISSGQRYRFWISQNSTEQPLQEESPENPKQQNFKNIILFT